MCIRDRVCGAFSPQWPWSLLCGSARKEAQSNGSALAPCASRSVSARRWALVAVGQRARKVSTE
eukprot:6307566-Alexandrium_andersonii.AAC.1